MKHGTSLAGLTLTILVAVGLTGCSEIRARQAFKDGNKNYKEENFRKAIEKYDAAIALEPNEPAAHFYRASSYQALYRPGRTDIADNKQRLDTAIEGYKKVLELSANPKDEAEKQVKANALAALTGIHADDPYKNYDEAVKYAHELVGQNPTDSRFLLAMANLYEKFEKTDEAEAQYKRIRELHPNDPKLCSAVAGFYNKPLWPDPTGKNADGKRSRFDDAIATLRACAELEPNDPGGFHKVAVFYWDKAYRDASLEPAERDTYANEGLTYADKALALKPDYFEAVVFKNLLYRVKASATTDPRQRAAYLDEAEKFQKLGVELKKQAQEAQAQQAALATPSPAS